MHDLSNRFRQILSKELIPALGCTEPISLAYGAALCRKILDTLPEKIEVACSGNIIKNTKSVLVPNSNGMKGIESAIALGTVAGNEEGRLEVLENVTENDIDSALEYMRTHLINVTYLNSTSKLHFIIKMTNLDEYASIEIRDSHTRVVHAEKNGIEVVPLKSDSEFSNDKIDQFKDISVESIISYAENEDVAILHDFFDEQIKDNWNIALEGLERQWGSGVGNIVLHNHLGGIFSYIEALSAAGSDARMSGCSMPVVINSGSGNQGIVVSVPVIAYAKENNISEERLLRALAISNLLALYQKSSIGRLSAFCGAVSASIGAGAAITWLAGGSREQISGTIVNILAIISGIICDGAKPSCAGKIAICINAALISHLMAMDENSFSPGDGIVKADVDKTMKGIGDIACIGMKNTDDVILQIMLEK